MFLIKIIISRYNYYGTSTDKIQSNEKHKNITLNVSNTVSVKYKNSNKCIAVK